jgi:hypothetical protein
MKKTKFLSLLPSVPSVLAGCFLLPAASVAQTPINLTQDATVQSVGTYTYYARGEYNVTTNPYTIDTITPFTTMFYPRGFVRGNGDHIGLDNGLDDSKSTPASISFSSGCLTDGTTSGDVLTTAVVSGYIGVEQLIQGNASNNHVGTFNIVFDLGAVYTITGVIISYANGSGAYWSSLADAQTVYTSLTNPSSDKESGNLFATNTASSSSATTEAELSFVGAATDARYVTLELAMTLSPVNGSGQRGGHIYEVAIMGYAAVPEPGMTTMLAALCAFVTGVIVRIRARK